MASKSSSSAGGIGMTGALFLIFLVLKLCHVIAWSWWWVFAPLWIPAGILMAVVLFCLLMAILTGQLSTKTRRG